MAKSGAERWNGAREAMRARVVVGAVVAPVVAAAHNTLVAAIAVVLAARLPAALQPGGTKYFA